jgi:hypothetical protein
MHNERSPLVAGVVNDLHLPRLDDMRYSRPFASCSFPTQLASTFTNPRQGECILATHDHHRSLCAIGLSSKLLQHSCACVKERQPRSDFDARRRKQVLAPEYGGDGVKRKASGLAHGIRSELRVEGSRGGLLFLCQRAIQIECGTDQGYMGERLRKVAKGFAPRTGFFRV